MTLTCTPGVQVLLLLKWMMNVGLFLFFSVLNKKIPFYYIQWHFQEHAANSIAFTETLDLICQAGYE